MKNKFYHEYLSLFSTAFKTIIRNLKKKKFEPDVQALDKIVKPGDVCLDVGGAYGRYALCLSRVAGPSGRIFSFEPGSYSYNVFKIIKWFHRLNNVSIHKLALADKKGSINLCLPVKKTGRVGASLAFISSSKEDSVISESVSMTTIDDFCREKRIERVSFIKCDTEGSELLVFKGGLETIKKSQPVVLAEVDAGNMSRYGCRISDLEDFFRGLGYKISSYKDGKFTSNGTIGPNGNYFFTPRHFILL